jgi:hypothetical protein
VKMQRSTPRSPRSSDFDANHPPAFGWDYIGTVTEEPLAA